MFTTDCHEKLNGILKSSSVVAQEKAVAELKKEAERIVRGKGKEHADSGPRPSLLPCDFFAVSKKPAKQSRTFSPNSVSKLQIHFITLFNCM